MKSNLEVVSVPISELVEYANNAKLHPAEQVDQIAASIEEFGFNSPILAWHNEDGEPEIVAGHGRLMAAKKLIGEGHDELSELPTIFLDHLTEEQRRAYILVDNKLTMNSDFDYDMLMSELDSLGNIDMEDFGFVIDADVDIDYEVEDEDLSEDYSQNVGTVHYEPKQTDHKVSDLYYLERPDLDSLIAGIKDDDLRKMFELRKAWFTEFNFAKVADYYAYQATPEEQRVFEALGMVLLDKNQLIANGFAKIVEDV